MKSQYLSLYSDISVIFTINKKIFFFTTDWSHHRNPRLVKMHRTTVHRVCKHTLYIYNAFTIYEAQGTLWKKRQKECKSQRTRKSSLRYLLSLINDTETIPPIVQLVEENLSNKITSWHGNMDGEISQVPIPRWKEIGNNVR